MKDEIKLKHDLTQGIVEDFRGLEKHGVEVYFRTGDKIIVAAAGSGWTPHRMCKTIARVSGYELSETTLRICVRFSQAYSEAQRKTIYATHAPMMRVRALCHSQYDARRAVILTKIAQGKRQWKSLEEPGQKAERVRREVTRKRCVNSAASVLDNSFDPSEIRIRILVSGEIDTDAIEDGFASIISRTSVEVASKLFASALKRVKKGK